MAKHWKDSNGNQWNRVIFIREDGKDPHQCWQTNQSRIHSLLRSEDANGNQKRTPYDGVITGISRVRARTFNMRMKLRTKITFSKGKAFWTKMDNSLAGIAKEIRSLVIPMQGAYYGKLHATTIALKYKKARQMGQALRKMISNSCIPTTSMRLLYDLIKIKESDMFLIDDEWKTVGGRKRECINCIVGDSIGTLIMALQPVVILSREAQSCHNTDV